MLPLSLEIYSPEVGHAPQPPSPSRITAALLKIASLRQLETPVESTSTLVEKNGSESVTPTNKPGQQPYKHGLMQRLFVGRKSPAEPAIPATPGSGDSTTCVPSGSVSPSSNAPGELLKKTVLMERITRGHRRAASAVPDLEKKSTDAQQLSHKYSMVSRNNMIGKGANAIVRLAYRVDSQVCAGTKLYAVKEFRKRRKEESPRDYMRKLTSEFCISSNLDHPNVVKTLDLLQNGQDDRWCQVMEYCAAGDLLQIIRDGCMTSVEINCCFKQLIAGVAYLHSIGVSHRDIKPENLLMDSDGCLKITDFGVSDVFRVGWESTSHKCHGRCGSEPYMAPEMFLQKDYDGEAIDVWACGIVYFTMAYNRIPFRVAAVRDTFYTDYLEDRAKGRCEFFRNLGSPCRNLLMRILEPNVSERATIGDIQANAWFQSLDVCHGSETCAQRHIHYSLDTMAKIEHRRNGSF